MLGDVSRTSEPSALPAVLRRNATNNPYGQETRMAAYFRRSGETACRQGNRSRCHCTAVIAIAMEPEGSHGLLLVMASFFLLFIPGAPVVRARIPEPARAWQSGVGWRTFDCTHASDNIQDSRAGTDAHWQRTQPKIIDARKPTTGKPQPPGDDGCAVYDADLPYCQTIVPRCHPTPIGSSSRDPRHHEQRAPWIRRFACVVR
jgi:hypothetical protein